MIPAVCRPVLFRFSALLLAAFTFGSCRSILSPKYEYAKDVFVSLDGSATVYVNASVPALVALRGAGLNVDPRARLDRSAVRAFFESPVTNVASVNASRRNGRRYVHVRLDVADVRRLSQARAFAWSTYSLAPAGEYTAFR